MRRLSHWPEQIVEASIIRTANIFSPGGSLRPCHSYPLQWHVPTDPRDRERILAGKDVTIHLQNCRGIFTVPQEQTGTWCLQRHVKGMKKISLLRSLQTG